MTRRALRVKIFATFLERLSSAADEVKYNVCSKQNRKTFVNAFLNENHVKLADSDINTLLFLKT